MGPIRAVAPSIVVVFAISACASPQKTTDGGEVSAAESAEETAAESGEDETASMPDGPTRRVRMFQQACRKGSKAACYNLGVLYHHGADVEQDYARARDYYDKTCPEIAQACNNLGQLHDNGLGVDADLGRAVELYEQACEGGDMAGCTNLASMFHLGRGTDKDPDRATELFLRACDGGDPDACKALEEIENNNTLP